jgi:hypothetical protein
VAAAVFEESATKAVDTKAHEWYHFSVGLLNFQFTILQFSNLSTFVGEFG